MWITHCTPVFNAVDAKPDNTLDTGIVGRVGCNGESITVRLVDHGFQFFVGHLQGVVVGHDLDQVGPAPDLISHGSAHFVGTAGLAASPIGMPARLDDGLAGDQEPWAWEDSLLDRLLRVDIGSPHAEVADQGYA